MAENAMISRKKKIGLAGGLLALLAVLSAFLWIRTLGSYTPAAAYRDVRAAMQVSAELKAGKDERPVERFLEIRYGPLADAGNYQAALRDFFNMDHIEGLYLVMKRLSQEDRQACLAEMAALISKRRQTMSAEEKEALRTYFDSAEGKAMVRQSTLGYLRKDSRFRTEAAPVVAQIMTTLSAIQKP